MGDIRWGYRPYLMDGLWIPSLLESLQTDKEIKFRIINQHIHDCGQNKGSNYIKSGVLFDEHGG